MRRIRKGDEVMVLPSGKRSRVKSIVTYDGELEEAERDADARPDVHRGPGRQHDVREGLQQLGQRDRLRSVRALERVLPARVECGQQGAHVAKEVKRLASGQQAPGIGGRLGQRCHASSYGGQAYQKAGQYRSGLQAYASFVCAG